MRLGMEPQQKQRMAKKSFLKLITYFSAGLVLLALAVNSLVIGELLTYPILTTPQAVGQAVVAAAGLMLPVGLLVRYELPFMRRIQDRLELFKALLLGMSHVEKIYISVLAGVSEELLFRGCLQPLVGIAVASVIFGALHAFTFSYFLLATAIGVYLGVLLQWSGNLFVPMAVHALYDIFALNLMIWVYRKKGDADGETQEPRVSAWPPG